MASFPFFKQLDTMDCGPTCLRMISKYFGKSYTLQQLRDKSGLSREGVSLQGISSAAENIGFRTFGAKLSFDVLQDQVPLPCIAHWDQSHFVVVYNISKKGKTTQVHLADPASELLTISKDEFLESWASSSSNGQLEGIILALEPTPAFYDQEEFTNTGLDLSKLFSYLIPYRKLLWQLGLGLFVSTLLQLVFPFLTQSIVDFGVNTQNLNFIYVVLAAQLMLFAGRTSIEFIRSWILLHIGSRVNISLLSDFLFKLMKLPLSFFDTKMFGDIMQRIQDHERIEQLLTSTTLQVVFSLVNVIVFGLVLSFYHLPLFLVFLTGTVLYSLWIFLLLKKRRKLDYKQFNLDAKNQSKIVQLISGMQEIKLSNSETIRRWEWEIIQASLFKLKVKVLALNQYQQAGAFFLNEGKNILITFLAAKAVIEGQMTLGAMLAVQYIIGQLNSPIEQLLGFMQTLQNASISIERLNEIHTLEDEQIQGAPVLSYLPDQKSLHIKNLSFSYPGSIQPILTNINLHIPQGKVTAIVGMSGSGKTTLLKLLLKFYLPTTGEIRLGDANLKYLSHSLWRSHCGVVMQDGYIFSDTIAKNIALSDQYPNISRLLYAVKMANINSFIDSLPLGYNTIIGEEGNGLSQGQKQRFLIARAIYKDPSFIFLDEATNALDANNESIIINNLTQVFKGKTVIVVAHRLSTVQHADQIVVLDKGEISEVGTHQQLTELGGNYYQLVKNQLELGN
ncbi:peptidase domain-containing ABC transporter [Xanthocytophaga flava]|uniref:peptidase domain-containing ABC transporter n=1 Tax=Xanthocytophaga flava TaxID=3048013 RepID=UPI0028D4E0DE|nr:peptidase domain-containing ABC transporter [Xanthocytophaga flavus]MDJ1470238.1 peptidase domain-containing ABC transporter [Xanthocytophaga flavus]